MLILSEPAVASLLSMRDAIDAVGKVFEEHARGRAAFPLRSVAMSERGLVGAMPGSIREPRAALGAKLVTVFSGNALLGKHTHNALIVLFSTATGEPVAAMDGRYITEVRTAAASAVATRALAGPEAASAAILGTGVQAKAHVDALRELGTFKSIRIWGREPARSTALAAHFSTGTMRVTAAPSIADACRGADVVCTVTASAEPILGADDVEPGAHINAVGACTPRARELAADLVSTSRIVCDSREGAMTEAGDILLAIADGALQAPPHIALLGDVLTGKTEGRRSSDEITLFESLGVAIEDLACAELVFDRATAQGIGVTVDI